MTFKRLATIHGWQRSAAHLSFVPAILKTNSSNSVHVEGDRVWDLVQWMPGEPARDPEAACAALAPLHRAWRPATIKGPVPAVQRRLNALADWQDNHTRIHASIPEWLRRGRDCVSRLVQSAGVALRSVSGQLLPLQPCLCDVHRDHVRVTQGQVTGIIDYGAMKIDHVSVDLARFLGDLAGEDDIFERGIEAYKEAGGSFDVPSTFLRLMDRSGALCAVIGWLLRLGVANSLESVPGAVRDRVERLTARLEHFSDFRHARAGNSSIASS